MGLPIDETYGADTAKLRGPGRHLGEFASLAVNAEARRSGLVFLLVVSMWAYAEQRANVTDLVVAISEEIGDYYQAIFNFRPYTSVHSYQGFGETCHALDEDPVIGLVQDVAAMREHVAQNWPQLDDGQFNVASVLDDNRRDLYECLPEADLSQAELNRYKLPRAVRLSLFDEAFGFAPVLIPGERGCLMKPYEAVQTGEHLAVAYRRPTQTSEVPTEERGAELRANLG